MGRSQAGRAQRVSSDIYRTDEKRDSSGHQEWSNDYFQGTGTGAF
jgi:hypothetical protein